MSFFIKAIFQNYSLIEIFWGQIKGSGIPQLENRVMHYDIIKPSEVKL